MKNHIKIATLLLVGFTMVIALTACRGAISDTYKHSSKPQYFFVNGALLGSYDSNGWHSLCDTTGDYKTGAGNSTAFYAKDLLNQDSYYVYDGSKLLGISKQIIWPTEETSGLGCFEDKDAPKKFARYGKLYYFENNDITSYKIFDLPVKLGDELSKLQIPNYSFSTEFVFGEKWERPYSNYRLVTSSGVNLFPKTLNYDVEPTSQGKQAIIDLFKEKDMENTIPNFTECVLGDFDGDSKNEYLMVANSPRSELGWPIIVGEGKKDKVGTFSAALYQDDNGSMQILHSDMRPMKEAVEFTNGFKEIPYAEYSYAIDFPNVADLNGDGVYEITFLKGEWENGYTLAFSQDEQGVYSVVMRSNWGM